MSGQAYGPTVPYQTSTTTFVLSFSKFASGSSTSLQVDIGVSGSAGQYAYVDGIRLYEITQDEYNAIDSMTPEQIAAKWPYVDDMKNICSPYIIKYGENLLPPFTEWNVTAGSGGAPKMSVDDPYSVNLVADQSGQSVYVDVQAMPNMTYTLSLASLPVNGYIGFNSFDANMKFVNAYGGFTSDLIKTITTEGNVRYLKVIFGNNTFGAGIYKFSKPMLNLGTKAKSFKPLNEDYLFFPNVQLASNVDGTVYDTLFQRNGKYWKLARLKTMDLDGSLPWSTSDGYPGYKWIRLSNNHISSPIKDSGIVAKYDGKILTKIPQGTPPNSTDQQVLLDSADSNPNSVLITVSREDSGWGDSFNPSPEEIKAYFNGWRMCDTSDPTGKTPYNNLGTRGWYWVTDKDANPLFAATVPTSRAGNGWKPYKLQYQLATPTVEEIAVEGGITFHEGLNQVEVGNGMIVREKTSPNLYGPNNSYYFNDIAVGSQFKYRANVILNIFKNGLVDKSVLLMPGAHNANGYSKAQVSAANYDQRAAYSATYIALDQYALSCNVQSIQGEYADNLMNVVDSLVSSQTDVSTRVSILEGMHAQNMKGQWISPTLVNGWLEYADGYDTVRYIKDGFGVVHLKGLLKNGTLGAVIFTLPPGYRPKATKIFMTISDTNGSALIGRVDITANGDVRHTLGGAGYFSLEGITFLAEQ
ncbi:hypothetical protein [Paenibacillus ehimensis]|uniref:Uncharacterized protein n=1 Tax=Paenibacillus ehimensis TaxID=79264 RepID=A0ABT8VCH9_9BACL|nr:hypothetical protein [Paenibacillus ehimensis]MDO3678694.1 hypothetical protein [Paenibacillus ehimensis]